MPKYMPETTARPGRVSVAPFDGTDAEWDATVAGLPGSTFCHLAGWSHVLGDVLGHETFRWAAVDGEGQVCGVPAYLEGRIAGIRDYCEADTANTYLLYLRFQKLRGALSEAQYETECALLRGALQKQKAPHWREFLSRWPG
jgi:hypothetical protein